jgi:hypothetical protein
MTRLLSIPEPHVLASANLTQDFKALNGLHGFQMKFNNFNKISSHKLFLLMGEHWNMKAFLSLVTDY